jgi:aminoglycoside phosphotransferase (APT) family kinase protein
MFNQPLTSELMAATSAAAKAGLGVVTPHMLHLGDHTTVRLAPWPIVARIASGTSFDVSREKLTRELAIACHLASRGAPTVRPTTTPAPGPYLEDDCAITLWEFVDGRAVSTEADEIAAAASLQLVHRALADVDLHLPSFTTKVDSCETILTNSAEAPKLSIGDRLFLRRLYATLREALNVRQDTWQPLHGDAHLGNVLLAESGPIWMDLEAACLGPIEWDVVNLPVASWSRFSGIDAALMHLFADVRSFCVAVWCWAKFDRSAATAEAAIYHLGELKARFS